MSEVKFIRVRGRIVPIKRNKAVEGSALTAGGLAVAGGGGAASGKLIKKARDLRNKGRVGAQNIRSNSISRVTSLKDFRLRKGPTGKILKMGGRPAKINKSQLNMFSFHAESKAHKFNYAKRTSAYRRSLIGKKIFKHSNLLSSALVGLGVEKLVKSTGLEGKGLFGDFNSEVAGVGSALVTHSISSNLQNKVGHGVSLRKGFKKDIVSGFNKINKGRLSKSIISLLSKGKF